MGIVLIAVTGGAASWFVASWYGAAAAGAIAGAVGAAVNGGNILKGALYGAIGGVAAYAGVAASAMWGGIQSEIEGGSFGHGFLAAGIGTIGGSSSGPGWGGFIRSAVIGGVATEITGGKFKNGAASAAFMYAVSAGVNKIATGGKNNVTEEDKKAAQVAHCAYQDKQCSLDVYKNPNNDSGFKYVTHKSEDGTLYVGFAGTDTDSLKSFWADVKTNIMQGLGLKTAQYEKAVQLATELTGNGQNVIFTGHSLGGGLASAAAIASGSRAITFNSAGLSWRYGGWRNSSNIKTFYDATDFLNGVQDISMGVLPPGAIGSRVMLPAKGFHGVGSVCEGMGIGGRCGN